MPIARQRFGIAHTARTIFLVAALIACGSRPASAAQFTIVALGASNTYGKGVPRGSDYPAQFEAMLQAKGIDATVVNAGISGDTVASMLNRLESAVPAGTSVVILQPGSNDRRRGVGDRGDNFGEIVGRLKARNIKVIMLQKVVASASPQHLQPDGEHLMPEGYRLVAARLLPQVTAAIGR